MTVKGFLKKVAQNLIDYCLTEQTITSMRMRKFPYFGKQDFSVEKFFIYDIRWWKCSWRDVTTTQTISHNKEHEVIFQKIRAVLFVDGRPLLLLFCSIVDENCTQLLSFGLTKQLEHIAL